MRNYMLYEDFIKTMASCGIDEEELTTGTIDGEDAYIYKNDGGCILAAWLKDSGEYREF